MWCFFYLLAKATNFLTMRNPVSDTVRFLSPPAPAPSPAPPAAPAARGRGAPAGRRSPDPSARKRGPRRQLALGLTNI